jgi:hypothetical protein
MLAATFAGRVHDSCPIDQALLEKGLAGRPAIGSEPYADCSRSKVSTGLLTFPQYEFPFQAMQLCDVETLRMLISRHKCLLQYAKPCLDHSSTHTGVCEQREQEGT